MLYGCPCSTCSEEYNSILQSGRLRHVRTQVQYPFPATKPDRQLARRLVSIARRAQGITAILMHVRGKVSGHFNFEEKEKRVTFVGASSGGNSGSIWALKFATSDIYLRFCQQYSAKLLENVTGKQFSEAAFEEVGPDASCRICSACSSLFYTRLPMGAKCDKVTCCGLWVQRSNPGYYSLFEQSSGVGSREARLPPINGGQVRDKSRTEYTSLLLLQLFLSR